MIFKKHDSDGVVTQLISFARECAWLDPSELRYLEKLAPFMTPQESEAVLESLTIEARLRARSEGG